MVIPLDLLSFQASVGNRGKSKRKVVSVHLTALPKDTSTATHRIAASAT